MRNTPFLKLLKPPAAVVACTCTKAMLCLCSGGKADDQSNSLHGMPPVAKASPDMGGVSADGKMLWLSGRYHKEVCTVDTANGHLLAPIKVGNGPHGLCVSHNRADIPWDAQGCSVDGILRLELCVSTAHFAR